MALRLMAFSFLSIIYSRFAEFYQVEPPYYRVPLGFFSLGFTRLLLDSIGLIYVRFREFLLRSTDCY